MKNYCKDCASFKTQHFLTSNLLHDVRYICTAKKKIVKDKKNGACNMFLDRRKPFQSGENY